MEVFKSAKIEKELDLDTAEYISSINFDYEILNAVVWVNAVHLRILYEKDLVKKNSLEKALEILKNISENPPRDLDPRIEDIHAYIEKALSEFSEEVAGMLSYGKSRNDAVATAIRIRAREYLLETMHSELILAQELLRKAGEHVRTLFPVYTHLQRAAPATLGFILHSYASKILRNVSSLPNIYSRVNLSPLGAGAAVGSSTEIDRLREAQLLGFEDVIENSLDATTSRDFIITLISYLLNSGLTYSCLAEELVIYSSQEFNLIILPDGYVSTSSIMPHKRNPVVAEIARTKIHEVLGELVKIIGILSRQPSGYNLDYQQSTPKLWSAFREIKKTAKILTRLIQNIQVNTSRALELCGGSILLTEIANKLVKNFKVTYRKAYQLCSEISKYLDEGSLDEEKFRSIVEKYGLSELDYREFKNWMDPGSIVESYRTLGSPNPEIVEKMIEIDSRRVEALIEWCENTLEKNKKLFSKCFSIQ
ncbi:MAG: argininosuccinate lyase [Nitrososphaerota archaeon]